MRRCLVALAFVAACSDGNGASPIDGAGGAPPDALAGDDGGSARDGSAGAGGSDAGTTGSISYTLTFVPGSAYLIYASVAGGPAHEVQLDTGSNGMFVPKAVLGPTAQLTATTCSITYVSSGNMLTGHYATAPVALLGSTKAGDVPNPPTTVPMPVCAVDDPSWNGGMLGIGYGRGAAPDPSTNVMWQWADAKAGTMHAGFVLSTHPAPQMQIGLTPTARAGFTTVQLQPDASHNGDWLASSLKGCVAVGSFSQCGSLLVDTGIGETILWGPSDPTLSGTIPSGQSTVPNGTQMSIASPMDGSILDFAFTVGSGSDSPSSVNVRSAGGFSINTGRALLVDYDYLFDVVLGQVGFRHAP